MQSPLGTKNRPLSQNTPVLRFHDGTVALSGWEEPDPPPHLQWDERSLCWRAPAFLYSTLIDTFRKRNQSILDEACRFEKVNFIFKISVELFPHQKEAIEAWLKNGRRGSMVLPTGAGKTWAALYAMAAAGTSTLVVSPTLVLMNQWYDRITDAFGIDVGILGGGFHEIKPVTVTTYDSAFRHIDRYGDRFGLLIFDEIHHLPAPTYAQIPELSLAPFRLGLTATYRRLDALHLKLRHTVGPVVYEKRIKDLKGSHLSDYKIRRISVSLTPDETLRYESLQNTYRAYVHSGKGRFFAGGWERFIRESSFQPQARKALLARTELRKLVFGARNKFDVLETIFKQHILDRVIVFTENTDWVYAVSRQYLIPAITHWTDPKERKAVLTRFRNGTCRFLVTSRVLNEGVDVPEANVAVILSGSASPVAHLQRLGRILRKKDGKKAVLYEIVARNTQENSVSTRRRASDAYR